VNNVDGSLNLLESVPSTALIYAHPKDLTAIRGWPAAAPRTSGGRIDRV
jgi:hypothetical protein